MFTLIYLYICVYLYFYSIINLCISIAAASLSSEGSACVPECQHQSTWNSNISLLNYLKYCTVCEGIQVDWCYARISAKTWVAPWQSQKRDGKIGPRKSLVERETKQKLAGRDEDNQRRNGKLQISWFSRACLNQNGYRHMHFIFIYKYINIFRFS